MSHTGWPSDPDIATFRRVVGRFATGVVVVTTRTDEGLHGLTANAFCSVSLEPLLVLVCIDKLARGHDRVERAKAFAISILSDRQEFLADRFAGRGPLVNTRFDGAPFHDAVTGAPILEGSAAWLDCLLWATYDGGDHSIFVGQVVVADEDPSVPALLFQDSRYVRLGGQR